MSETVTFIHTADLHLGAPFRGLRTKSSYWSQRLLRAIPESFERLIKWAIDDRVDFMIIAGDIFDAARPSYADYLRFLDGMQRLGDAGIPVYVCAGNHDPSTSWRDGIGTLPANVTFFSAEEPSFALFERDGVPLVTFGGRSYYNQAWPLDTDITEGIDRETAERACRTRAPFSIGVVHSGLHLDTTKAPSDPKSLLRRNMDYWALGHIHMPFVYTEDDPRIVFPGVLQGRDIKETGERGAMKVCLHRAAPSSGLRTSAPAIVDLTFKPLASVVWQKFAVDVSDLSSIAQLRDLISRTQFALNAQAHCEEMICRVVLTGATRLHRLLREHNALEDVRTVINDAYPMFYIDAIIDETRALIDKDAVRAEGMFPATFLSVAHDLSEQPAACSEFLQERFVEKGLQLPHSVERDLPELMEQAQDMVLDLLGRDAQ